MPAAIVADGREGPPGVAIVSSIRDTQAKTQGRRRQDLASDRAEHGLPGLQVRLADGLGRDAARSSAEPALVEKDTPRGQKLKVGESRSRSARRAANVTLTVRGIYNGQLAAWPAFIDDRGAVRADRRPKRDSTSCSVKTDERRPMPTRSQKRVRATLASFPEARAQTTQDQFKKAQRDQVNQILVLFYALLAMSVIISLFGIVNTLTLSIFERTREIGMLRAIGMTRRDVRRMVRYESVITAVIGGAARLVVGLFFGSW